MTSVESGRYGSASKRYAVSDRQIVERIVLPTLMKALVQSVREGLGADGDCLTPVLDLLS